MESNEDVKAQLRNIRQEMGRFWEYVQEKNLTMLSHGKFKHILLYGFKNVQFLVKSYVHSKMFTFKITIISLLDEMSSNFKKCFGPSSVEF